MKSLYNFITEQLSSLISQRMEITIHRLAYLKFAMEDNDKDKGLKEMYDTLYNLIFAKDGHTRSNKELLDYLKKEMEDNLGDIPGLPSNDAVEAIDKKVAALDEMEPKNLQHYIKEVEKEIADSESSSKGNNPKTSLEKEISDEELMKKLSDMVNKEGLSNILGLEKSKKMSAGDKEKLASKKANGTTSKEEEDDEVVDQETEDDKEIENFIETGKMKEPEKNPDLSSLFIENFIGFSNNIILEKEDLPDDEKEKKRQEEIIKTLTAMKFIADNEKTIKDSKYIESSEKNYEFTKKMFLNDDGTFKTKKESKAFYRKNKKDIGGWSKRNQYSYMLGWSSNEKVRNSWKSEKPDIWKKSEKTTMNELKKLQKEDDFKDIIKDRDGSEIRPRQKRNGKGMTFVRVKNGHEIGYATKKEYLAAKHRK